jgi:hypothetical protein
MDLIALTIFYACLLDCAIALLESGGLLRDSLFTFSSILTLLLMLQATQVTRAVEFYGPDRAKVFGKCHAKRLLARWSGTSSESL